MNLQNHLIQAHPWHGISAGENAPVVVTAFIEIVPLDTVKYEIDKASGHLKVDRPNKFSSVCPMLYGFIPRTYCGERVSDLARARAGEIPVEKGDGDPLDICVLTERAITRGGVIVTARPIGGLRMIDRGEADDKIIAVLMDDPVFGEVTDLSQVSHHLVDRLKHYFLTYKEMPDAIPGQARKVEIAETYGQADAQAVIRATQDDYHELLRQHMA